MLRKISAASQRVAFWNVKCGRLYMTLVWALAFLSNCMVNNTLSMAIVCMVNATAVAEMSNKTRGTFVNSTTEEESLCASASTNDESEYEGPFVWSNRRQGTLFSALFIGGLLSILPSGWLSDRYNPKAIGTVGLVTSTLGCFLTPILAVNGGYIALFIIRFITGFFGIAIIMSGISSISARWIPPTERSTVIAIYTAGNQISNFIGMPMNSMLCRSPHFLGGWPAIFYVNAFFGVIACALWMIFLTNDPETNKFITEREKIYITQKLATENLGTRQEVMKQVPWLKILFTPVMLTLFLNNFANGFIIALMMTYLPTYFKEALSLDLKSNGFFSALPYVCQFVSTMAFAAISDSMKKRTTISHTRIAKCFNTIGAWVSCPPDESYNTLKTRYPAEKISFFGIGSFGTSIFLVACGYMDCTTTVSALIFLSVANTLFSACIPGWATCLACVAPAYTGIIGAIGRFSGQIGAVLSPYVVSLIVVEGTATEWRTVFFVVAAFMSFSGVMFIIFGSAELQHWAKQRNVTYEGKELLTTIMEEPNDKEANNLLSKPKSQVADIV